MQKAWLLNFEKEKEIEHAKNLAIQKPTILVITNRRWRGIQKMRKAWYFATTSEIDIPERLFDSEGADGRRPATVSSATVAVNRAEPMHTSLIHCKCTRMEFDKFCIVYIVQINI